MKKKVLFSLFIGIGVMVCFASKALFVSNTTDPILLANAEALATTETATSWNCDGSNSKVCSMRCGQCSTYVRGTGKTCGTHSCD